MPQPSPTPADLSVLVRAVGLISGVKIQEKKKHYDLHFYNLPHPEDRLMLQVLLESRKEVCKAGKKIVQRK